MRRRKFITLLGGAAAWPLAARAQQPAGRKFRLGVLQPPLDNPIIARGFPAFLDELNKSGFSEGKNLTIDFVRIDQDVQKLAIETVAHAKPDGYTLLYYGTVIRIGDIELAPARREVRKAGEFIHLTPKEFDLLHYLMAHAGLPITHGRLLNAVWGPEYGEEADYLRVYVRQLRKKVEATPSEPHYIMTEPGVGYVFRQQVFTGVEG